MKRLLISICGGSGSGKSTLAKALADHLGEGRAGRVPTDFFLVSNPYKTLTEFFRHPLAYDWTLLAERLQGPDGALCSTPQYDFIRFQRIASQGGRSFQLCPVMVIDSMLPYPGADFCFRVDAPDEIRRARIVERDKAWGSSVIDFWPQHQLTLAQLRASGTTFHAVLSGLDPIDENVQKMCALAGLGPA